MSSESKEVEANKDPRDVVDDSCKGPFLFLAFSAIIWLLVYSIFSLLSGVKVHSYGMMVDTAWLSYGRIQPASQLALQYGFLVQLGLAISAWILSHRGKTVLVDGGYLYFGGLIWNVGVTLGFVGILSGGISGLEGLQMPVHVIPILLTGYVLVGVSLVQTNNRRTDEQMSPAQWFLFTATLWLPWILGSAYLLIYYFKAKGVMANIVDWWFMQNFSKVYLTFIALGVCSHFFSLSNSYRLIGRGYALFAFWILLLFGSIGGVSLAAPVPAWLPALSTVTSVFYFIGIVSIWYVLYHMQNGASAEDNISLMRLGLIVFGVVSILNFLFAFPVMGKSAEFTTFGPSIELLFNLGFVGLVLLASFYYIFPHMVKFGLSPKITKIQNIIFILGFMIASLPSALGGLMSGDAVLGSGFYFSSVGDLFLVFASLLLFLNFLYAIIMSMKTCDCFSELFSKGEAKEVEA